MWDPLTNILLIGWWGSNWESTSSTFWFQPIWDLHRQQHTINFFYLMGVSVSKTTQRTWLRIVSIVLEEELKMALTLFNG